MRPVLAYVFWHWMREGVDAADYEARQRAFHVSLLAHPPAGFSRSRSARVSGALWAAGGGESYEDWYLIEGFAALEALNRDAVTAPRAASHDAAAALAAGGVGGLYSLKLGSPSGSSRHAHWFGKPAGMRYDELLDLVAPSAEGGALWMRQMVLGPAGEFCLQTPAPISLPTELAALVVPLETIWPD